MNKSTISEPTIAETGPAAFNEASHWVTRIIKHKGLVGDYNPLLSSVVRFGLLPNLFTVYLLLTRGEQLGIDIVTGIIFGTVWINIGPFLIWYYDELVLPSFFEKCRNRLQDEHRVRELAEKYDRLFSEKSWIVYIPWSISILATFWLVRDFFVSAGLFELGTPLYYIFYGIALYFGIMTGIGFMGVVTTLLAVREVSSNQLTIDPLHPDGLGGMSFFGYYAIRTTVTFSSGSLFFPLAFAVAGSRFRSLVMGLLVVYMATILASFVYPTFRVNRRAGEIREKHLDELKKEYANAKRETARYDKVNSETDVSELVKQLELQRLRNEYEDYSTVNLYPMEVWVLIRLVSSVILPLVFIFIDSYLKNLIRLFT